MFENFETGQVYDISNIVFKDGSDKVISDNFVKEDLIYHAFDDLNRGLFTWVDNNIYADADIKQIGEEGSGDVVVDGLTVKNPVTNAESGDGKIFVAKYDGRRKSWWV